MLILDIFFNNWKILLTIFILQGCLGIALVELSFKKFKRAIEVVEERDSLFPSYRRLDVQNWKRIVFYPGAFFFLIPRLLMFLGTVISFGVGLKLCYLVSGQSAEKPLSGPWRSILELIVKYHCLAICYNDGYRPTHTFKDFD